MAFWAVLAGVLVLWLFVVRGGIVEARQAAAIWQDSSGIRYAWEYTVELVTACGARLVAFGVYAAVTVGLFAIGLGPAAVVLFLLGCAAVAFVRWMKRGYDEERAKPLDVVEFGDRATDAPGWIKLRDLREVDDLDLFGRKVRWHHINVEDVARYT